MESLQINTGEKRICINDDPTRVIIFNPSDRSFIERFYNLIHELQDKAQEFEKREAELLGSVEVDKLGAPANFQEVLEIQKDVCSYLRERIDHVFGDGTSQVVFGEYLNPYAILEFLDQVSPLIASARNEKIAKYSDGANGQVMK